MARIRTIKPEFPQSESMGRVSREARLLFIMLWTIVDDDGRSRAASRMLASVLYPYDDDAKKHLGSWMAELVKENCVRLYEIDGAQYLQIEKWREHQKIDKPSKSRLPDPPSRDFANVREPSATPREVSSADLVPSTLDLGPKPRTVRASRFDEFWISYPRKVNKAKAKALFDKLDEAGQSAAITAAPLYAKKQSGTEEKFIAHPSSWLSARRWEDEDASNIIRPTVFNSGEEAELQRMALEKIYAQKAN